MKITEPTLETLRSQFVAKASGNYDETVAPSDLHIDGDEKAQFSVHFEGTEELEASDIDADFSESALGQLLNKVQVPVQFYKRCPIDLQIANFRYFNSIYEKDYLFRFNDAVKKGHVRAVLSDRYSVIDDLDLFDIIFEVLQNRTDVSYRCLQYDDRITQLIINFNDCKGEYGGQEYTAGLSITNSETGHSSVWVEPIVHTRNCSFYNRRVLRSQGVDCRIVHRGKLASDRVRPMVEKAKEIAQVGIIQLAEAFESHITRDHALRSAAAIDALPSRFVQILEEEWAEQQEVIRAEAARRIVLFAQELPLFQRIQVEQAAGKILGLFKNYKARFSDLAREISNV